MQTRTGPGPFALDRRQAANLQSRQDSLDRFAQLNCQGFSRLFALLQFPALDVRISTGDLVRLQTRITSEQELFSAAMEHFQVKIEIRQTATGVKLLPALKLGKHQGSCARPVFFSNCQVDLGPAGKMEAPFPL